MVRMVYQIFAILTLSLLLVGNLSAQSLKLQQPLQWSKLQYEASKFFFTVKSDITLERQANEAVRNKLLTPSSGKLIPVRSDYALKISTQSEIFGTTTKYILWFNDDTSVIQRIKIRTGDKQDIRLNRFSLGGIYEYYKKRQTDSLEFDLFEFNDVDTAYDAYERSTGPTNVVTESTLFLYLVSVLDYEAIDDSLIFTVLSRGDINYVKFANIKPVKLYMKFEMNQGGESQKIKGERNAYAISVLPTDSNGNINDKFRLLGMKGKLVLFVDKQLKTLVQITGDVDVLGTVNVKLKKAIAAN